MGGSDQQDGRTEVMDRMDRWERWMPGTDG